MKICILGNSVALRIRPPRRLVGDSTYAELLQTDGHDVDASARAGTMINEAFGTLDDDVVCRFPDCVIIHYGVVEICLRQYIRAINNRTIINYYLNAHLGRPYQFASFSTRCRVAFWRLLNRVVRVTASVLGLRWQWLARDQYITVVRAIVEHLLKETGASILVVGITPCSDRVERILNGSGEEIQSANTELSRITGLSTARVRFIDLAAILSAEEISNLTPDGVHFSAEGHRRMHAILRDELRHVTRP